MKHFQICKIRYNTAMSTNHSTTIKIKDSLAVLHISVVFTKDKSVDLVYSAIKDALVKSSKELKLSDMDIYLTLNDYFVIVPELGFGGITHSSQSLLISVDSGCKASLIKSELAPMLAHELSHAARAIKRPIYNWDDLLCREDMIMEGLAQVFQEAIYPGSYLYLNDEVISNKDSWLNKIKPFLDKKRTEYNRSAWFFGNDSTPRWVAYTLGYILVKDYIKKHKVSLQDLNDIDTNKVLVSYGI